jgi:hypothetical protein
MQRALDARAVVVAESSDVGDHIVNVLSGHLSSAEENLSPDIARLWSPPQVQNYLKEFVAPLPMAYRLGDIVRRKRIEQGIQIIRYYLLHSVKLPPFLNPKMP